MAIPGTARAQSRLHPEVPGHPDDALTGLQKTGLERAGNGGGSEG